MISLGFGYDEDGDDFKVVGIICLNWRKISDGNLFVFDPKKEWMKVIQMEISQCDRIRRCHSVVVSAWSFLLTTLDSWALNSKSWQESVSYFSTLLRQLRIASGEALALLFEIGSLEKFCGEANVSANTLIEEGKDSRNLRHMRGLRNKVLSQVRIFAAEASGKGTAKKDLNTQKNIFRDILDFLELGYTTGSSMKIEDIIGELEVQDKMPLLDRIHENLGKSCPANQDVSDVRSLLRVTGAVAPINGEPEP